MRKNKITFAITTIALLYKPPHLPINPQLLKFVQYTTMIADQPPNTIL